MTSKGNAPNSHPVEFDRIWIQAITEDLGNMKTNNAALSPQQRDELLAALIARFERHLSRHKGLEWARARSRICGTDKLWSLAEMERTGGEPDGAGQDKKSGEFVFMGGAPASPAGRRSC